MHIYNVYVFGYDNSLSYFTCHCAYDENDRLDILH